MDEKVNDLKKQGWHVSLDKIKEILQDELDETDDHTQFFMKNPEKWAINHDLFKFGIPCLPDGVNSGRVSQLSTPVVLQVRNIEIISAPQRNIESNVSPRMLKVSLTDGKSTCYGIEFSSLNGISMKTPPGTKILLINSIKLCNGFLLLEPKNFKVLGGIVSELVEEWKIQQLLIGHVRATVEDGGPPPWVPFGRKVQQIPLIEKEPKEELTDKDKEEKDEEFLSQRQDAIKAAVDNAGKTKVVKGSGKQIELQQTERRGRGRGGGGRNRDRDREDYSVSSRPRDSIRLFEFLEPQIGVEEAEEHPVAEEAYGGEDCYQERNRSYGRREESYHEQNEFQRGRGKSSRGNHGSYQNREESYRGRGGSSGRRGGSHHEREESHRGRGGSHYEREESHRGRGGSHYEREELYRGRGRSSRGRSGSSRARGASYREREDSYDSFRTSHFNRGSSNAAVDNLVEDFNIWPGLEPNPSRPVPKPEPMTSTTASTQWAVEDYCLAKWELSDQYYPAIIEQVMPSRKSATVLFVETGSIRIVELKNLRRDPQDMRRGEAAARPNNSSRGSMVFTSRNRGRY